ncbi:hypothetical protein N7495_003705 [Penicillium taxi]|uniref:uncharacterized protein n=1 Tax=Penicillium taxi TaxID=168475 RepID=UPI002545A4B3|nr:uncharacterized protein N7495_003705 [Penicillium taxi]KAJ5898961.1 hypothetical protein N7495_003705 [Penicillium taxi]
MDTTSHDDIAMGNATRYHVKDAGESKEENKIETASIASHDFGSMTNISDNTHRSLKPRHIQLLGIGGVIGTFLFVGIGKALIAGGPGSLFLSFVFWCFVILGVTECCSEMVTYLPISSPFIRFAGRFVDDAFGVATGWNFFIFQAILVPFEMVAVNIILNYWTDKIPVAAVVSIILVIYIVVNSFNVKYYGEIEFWLAIAKIFLIVGLTAYTFVTMVGGNPLHDKYGFRYWRDPGSFIEYYTTGNTGRFLGFVQCLISASVTVTGPEYISMTAGEAANPRDTMPKVFKSVFWRLACFFALGSLCIGIVVPSNSEDLAAAYSTSGSNAGASPYVISMNRLQIPILPHIVNGALILSALSTGNSVFYCASRSLYGLALEGKAPKFFRKTTKAGIPIFCIAAVILISLLAFLQVSSGSAKVFGWLVNIITTSQLINLAVICFTYLCFRKAWAVQKRPQTLLPYKARWQPYSTYFSLTCCLLMVFVSGYEVFLNDEWDTATFFFSYTMIGVFIVIFILAKIIKRSSFVRPADVDLVSDVQEIEDYTANYIETPDR